MKIYAAKLTLKSWPSVVPRPVIYFTNPPTVEDVKAAAANYQYEYRTHSVTEGIEVVNNSKDNGENK